MKNLLYLTLASVLFGFASCSDELNGDDRFMANPNPPQVDTTGYVKRFIVEDFTGQACVNCPDAAQMLTGLKEETYGDRMILVAMHAGGLSLGTPLHNQDAQTYMDALGLKNNPAVSVDRTYSNDGVFTTWAVEIANRSTVSTPCEVTQFFDWSDDRAFRVAAEVSFAGAVEDSLGVQHWILRDSIVSYQTTHTGLTFDYVHNHVFSGCLYSDVWGVPLAGADGGVFTAGTRVWSEPSEAFTLPDDWVKDDVSVVSFVFRYSDDESNPIAEIIQANMTHF